MAEVEGKASEREIMPQDLLRHHIEGRKRAYAGGGDYKSNPTLPGFKTFLWQNPDFSYHFEDSYTDNSQRPGNYSGFEINRNTDDGLILSLYTYGGGLTKEGEGLGEGTIYTRQKRFLADHVDEARFGKTVRFEFEDELGAWVYELEGKVCDWGWEDKEKISLNGKLVLEHLGIGTCYVPNY